MVVVHPGKINQVHNGRCSSQEGFITGRLHHTGMIGFLGFSPRLHAEQTGRSWRSTCCTGFSSLRARWDGQAGCWFWCRQPNCCWCCTLSFLLAHPRCTETLFSLVLFVLVGTGLGQAGCWFWCRQPSCYWCRTLSFLLAHPRCTETLFSLVLVGLGLGQAGCWFWCRQPSCC